MILQATCSVIDSSDGAIADRLRMREIWQVGPKLL